MKRHFVPSQATGFEINKQRKLSSNPAEEYVEPKVFQETRFEAPKPVRHALDGAHPFTVIHQLKPGQTDFTAWTEEQIRVRCSSTLPASCSTHNHTQSS